MNPDLRFRFIILWTVIIVGLGSLCVRAHADDLPDLSLTPGVARTDMTQAQMCATAWGKDKRAVTDKMKKQVFAEYGYPLGNKDPRCPCEIDHLVSRELLGADDVLNLWVQRYAGPWNAHLKDRVENRLHKETCTGKLSLDAAQTMLKTDWTAAYKMYFGEPTSPH